MNEPVQRLCPKVWAKEDPLSLNGFRKHRPNLSNPNPLIAAARVLADDMLTYPPVYCFDIDHGVNDALPPRRHSDPQECAPAICGTAPRRS